MEKFTKEIKDDNIIFTDTSLGKVMSIKRYEEDYIFDDFILDETFSIDFIEYIIRKLKASRDLLTLFATVDSVEIEELLSKYGIRISNTQYSIKNTQASVENNYVVEESLDDESTKYYLEEINRHTKINHEYFNPNEKLSLYEHIPFMEENMFRVYRQNNRIVGIVDFKVFEKNDFQNDETRLSKLLSCSDRIAVRALFTEDETVCKDILKDLMKIYNKDIILTITHTDTMLKNIINGLDGKFNCCQYILKD